MNYNLRIGDQTITVDADFKDDEMLTAGIGDKHFSVRYQAISENHIHIEVNGVGKNIHLSRIAAGKLINIDGATYLVQDIDVLPKSGVKKLVDKELPREITPPMPAVVVRIMVAEGDMVGKGDGIIVVSAMKMEITLRAPFQGRVLKINTKEREKVMPGQILVNMVQEEASKGNEDI